MVWASLTGASLTGASLTGASLTGASLTGASLTGASLTDASIIGASINGASATTASGPDVESEHAATTSTTQTKRMIKDTSPVGEVARCAARRPLGQNEDAGFAGMGHRSRLEREIVGETAGAFAGAHGAAAGDPQLGGAVDPTGEADEALEVRAFARNFFFADEIGRRRVADDAAAREG
ncbi:MAG: pentapeptide repeat-containing protein [Kofleriaceae bacterium]|nr:pentapeptide repeat-containing protein [Kofleriaceae bacterium]